MNNSKKRQHNIKNKLIAAVAMLLVSTIMMVSATYAWFTLSTAPEVQGITTTVGANGNLEIALMPYNGDLTSISSNVGDTNQAWNIKNLTWGNLLDLSEGYSLDEITLMPAQLDILAAANSTSRPTLYTSPLRIASYGADGRIDSLKRGEVLYGAKAAEGGADFLLHSDGTPRYGVRALGTSSSMSETTRQYQNALAAINTNRRAANTTLSTALGTYGNALASIALLHADGGSNDGNDYSAYVPEIKAMVAELSKADAAVEDALYNALMAFALTGTVKAQYPELYTTINTAYGIGSPLTNVWPAENSAELAALNLLAPILVDSYNAWVEASEAVEATVAAAEELPTDGSKVEFSQLSATLSGLMNIDYVTLNNKPVDPSNLDISSITNGSGINLQFNEGSGVFANYGELTQNISGVVVLGDGVEFSGQSLKGVEIKITTTTEPAEGALLDQTRLYIANHYQAAEDDQGNKNYIDVTYGYALDFVFRTNAANSSLLLQTAATQRIYGDSQNTATMGGGSTMEFDGKFNNLESLASMMSGIRVVFTETKGDSVYGIAKVVIENQEMVLVAHEVTGNTVSEETTNMPPLELTAHVNGSNVTLEWTNKGVDGSVTTVTGVDPVTKEAYTEFTVSEVSLTNGAYELDDEGETLVYRVYDQDITLKGDLCLFGFEISTTTGMLTFEDTPMATQALRTLDQNVATAVTALVYLDGDYIQNDDVVNSEDGISNTGKLNLQFASSANLVPMTNTTVKNGVGVEAPELPDGWTFSGSAMADKQKDYGFSIVKDPNFNGTYTVAYSIDGGEAQPLEANGNAYTVPGGKVDGNIKIIVTVTPAANP